MILFMTFLVLLMHDLCAVVKIIISQLRPSKTSMVMKLGGFQVQEVYMCARCVFVPYSNCSFTCLRVHFYGLQKEILEKLK